MEQAIQLWFITSEVIFSDRLINNNSLVVVKYEINTIHNYVLALFVGEAKNHSDTNLDI